MFNKAILIGRLVADPELRQTPTGTHVCSFRIAVDRRFTKGGERKADFLNIVAWRQSGEFVSRYFHKGDAIGVEGSIQTREYDDKNGVRRYATDIVADNVFFVGSKNSGQSGAPGMDSAPVSAPELNIAYASGSSADFEEMEPDNDLPF